MNIVYKLLQTYVYENAWSFGAIISITLIVNYLQTKMISQLTATIFDAVEKNRFSKVFDYMNEFIGITMLYITLMFVGEYVEIGTLTKIVQWMRHKFMEFIILSNNEHFTNADTIKYTSPINRVSYGAFVFLNVIVSTLLPNIAFIAVITLYMLYSNLTLGTVFLLSNLFIFGYGMFTHESIMEYKRDYEQSANENENYVLDVFNNFDKIILRGEAQNEIGVYQTQTDKCIQKVNTFHHTVEIHSAIMRTIVYVVILASLYYLVILRKDNALETKEFIALFTILLMYRDRFTSIIGAFPSILEINGRVEYATEKLKDLKHDFTVDTIPQYAPHSLAFEVIEFSGVYYKYKKDDGYLFNNLNLSIKPNHNIVGITGLSGRGKSTLMKLLLRVYPCEHGKITIDGQDILTIDPIYIRHQITYVGQSAKLFNKRIRDNLMYGCTHTQECEKHLHAILQYPKIQKLYENVD